ncbi:MAG: hypothetical protein KF831_10400 [Acidobacteria bacterium]|nr:hypothetical protein [Acidobacteriota bacterium]
MSFVDHLQGKSGEALILEVAFGKHPVQGDLAKSVVTGADPNHVVTIQQILGEAFGKGWKGPVGVWYAGFNRPAAKYRFYPGKFVADPDFKTFTANSATDVITCTAHGYSNGDMIIHLGGDLPAPIVAGQIYYVRDVTTDTYKIAETSGGAAINLTTNGSGTLTVFRNDPEQGIDPIFLQDHNHSNTAWIRVECPSGSEVGIPDANTKDNPPVDHVGIYECQLGDIYDEIGEIAATDQYLTNPADVLAFGCMEIRKYPSSRVDWESLDTLRIKCDQLITPDYTTLPQGVGLTGRYYEGTAFNTLKSTRVDPVLQFDLSTGAPEIELSPTNFSVRWEGKIRFKFTELYTFHLTHNDGGRLYIDNMTTPIIDQWGTTGSHSGTFSPNADQFYDIKVEWNNAASDSQLWLEWVSTRQPRQIVPQDRLYPKNDQRKRFESHIAFIERTSFEEFLKAILFTCNGAMQDADGKLKFFCLEDATSSFTFDESNIVKNSMQYYARFSQQDVLSLANRFIASGRDLDNRYLEPFNPPLEYDLTELQTEAGRINEQTVPVGNMNRLQALSNLAHYAKLQTAPMVLELEGMPQTFPVLPGDVVTVTHEMFDWAGKEFLVLEATDNSIDAGADNRKFKMLEWE